MAGATELEARSVADDLEVGQRRAVVYIAVMTVLGRHQDACPEIRWTPVQLDPEPLEIERPDVFLSVAYITAAESTYTSRMRMKPSSVRCCSDDMSTVPWQTDGSSLRGSAGDRESCIRFKTYRR